MSQESHETTTADKPRVLVLFGGRSSEHEVSCLSARGVLWAIDPDIYDVVSVGPFLQIPVLHAHRVPQLRPQSRIQRIALPVP